MQPKTAKAQKTKELQEAFISEYLRNGHNLTKAAEEVGINKSTAIRWNKEPEFSAKLAERIEGRKEAIGDLDKDLVERALARLKASIDDPEDTDSFMEVLRARLPEQFDPRIRFKLWEQAQLAKTEQEEPVTVFRRSDEPARLTLVKSEKSGTEG